MAWGSMRAGWQGAATPKAMGLEILVQATPSECWDLMALPIMNTGLGAFHRDGCLTFSTDGRITDYAITAPRRHRVACAQQVWVWGQELWSQISRNDGLGGCGAPEQECMGCTGGKAGMAGQSGVFYNSRVCTNQYWREARQARAWLMLKIWVIISKVRWYRSQ
ncbi:hypothetical protein BDW68DRAFT_183670 [Aspergillus falconensis]